MAKFRKNLNISENNYSGTGVLSKISFSGKFYLVLFLLIAGLLIQCILVLSHFYEYRNALANNGDFRKTNDGSLSVFRDLSQDLLEKFKISRNSGISVDVSDDLAKLIQASDDLKKNLGHNIALEQIKNIEVIIDQFGKVQSPLSTRMYQEAIALYDRFQKAVISLETALAEHYQRNYQEILVITLIKFAIVLSILLVGILTGKWLVRCALRSVEEPAERIIHCLQGSSAGLQVKLPIFAAEGLGGTGLILNDAIAKWHSLAFEFKNASNKLNYLIEEFVSGFNQLFFLEVQLREVYHEIESSLQDQRQVGKKVDEEIEMITSGLSGIQNLPRKISEISEEVQSLLTVNQNYLNGIINKDFEVKNESHNLMLFLRELGATSGRVDRIAKELGEIEEESEMLAFNSAISAARAGEEGQGFSVVAKEIANLVVRSKKASENLSGLISEIQTQTDHIVGLMPEKDEVESGQIVLDQIINSVFENLNETIAKCVVELDQIRQVAETIFVVSHETFEKVNLKFGSSPMETSGLIEIQKTIDRYLESVAYTGKIKDKIHETVNNLQSATDLLINWNA